MRKEKIKECENCKSDFTTTGNSVKFCSKQCRTVYNKNKKYEGKTEGIDYVTCKWCGIKGERIFGQHIRLSHPDKTEEDYKREFPGAPLYCETDKAQFSKMSGKHMKKEEYREMFSKKVKGDKNPNHKSNTTLEERRNRSPYSKSFWTSRGYSEADANFNISEYAKMDKNHSTTLEYWLDKTDGNIQEAEKLLKDRQTTFSLDKCIEKYGKTKGTEIWKKRQEKWLSGYKKNNFSIISQELFKIVYERIKSDFSEIYFATLNEDKELDDSGKNHEFRLSLDNKIILPDFLINDSNKIIEFDGSYWHNSKVQANKLREKERDNSILNAGYEVLHIKESDYREDPEREIKKCIDFIYAI